MQSESSAPAYKRIVLKLSGEALREHDGAWAALGNRVAVKEQYETLRGLLQKELGVEPAMQTQKTYHELVGK